jgi:hypothetical protein
MFTRKLGKGGALYCSPEKHLPHIAWNNMSINVFTEFCTVKLVFYNLFNEYVPSELAQPLEK